MKLREAQKIWRDTMLDHPDALQNLPEDFSSLFVHDDIAIDERLNIYRNNIVGSLTDAIVTTFPIIKHLVGEEFLEAMARCFILENPPTQGCLNTYGTGFDTFITDFPPAKGLPYLSDIARLEIALNDAYYATDDEALRAEELSAISPDALGKLNLRFRDSIILISSPYPLRAIRDFCLSEPKNDKMLDIDAGGVNLLIYRPTLDIELITLSDTDYHMLNNLRILPLGNSIESTMDKYPDFDFQKFLMRCVDYETFLPLQPNV